MVNIVELRKSSYKTFDFAPNPLQARTKVKFFYFDFAQNELENLESALNSII